MPQNAPDHRAHIRPKAICLFRHAGRILVVRTRDSQKRQDFYVAVGGGLEHGELSRDALVREVREELGVAIHSERLLGTLENIFTYQGALGHEIVFVYDARLSDERLYAQPTLPGDEEGTPFVAAWRPLAAFAPGGATLYPVGLFDLLLRSPA